jgi:hypothetical protein
MAAKAPTPGMGVLGSASLASASSLDEFRVLVGCKAQGIGMVRRYSSKTSVISRIPSGIAESAAG